MILKNPFQVPKFLKKKLAHKTENHIELTSIQLKTNENELKGSDFIVSQFIIVHLTKLLHFDIKATERNPHGFISSIDTATTAKTHSKLY